MGGNRTDRARSAYEAFNRGGVEAILEFVDPTIEWRMWETFARGDRTFHGHDGVREVLGIFEENYDDFRVDPHEFIEVGETVVVPVTLSGKAKGSGEETKIELVQAWLWPGEYATRLDAYSSKEEALAALGEDSARCRATAALTGASSGAIRSPISATGTGLEKR